MLFYFDFTSPNCDFIDRRHWNRINLQIEDDNAPPSLVQGPTFPGTRRNGISRIDKFENDDMHATP
jgi:hypothetical protein